MVNGGVYAVKINPAIEKGVDGDFIGGIQYGRQGAATGTGLKSQPQAGETIQIGRLEGQSGNIRKGRPRH